MTSFIWLQCCPSLSEQLPWYCLQKTLCCKIQNKENPIAMPKNRMTTNLTKMIISHLQCVICNLTFFMELLEVVSPMNLYNVRCFFWVQRTLLLPLLRDTKIISAIIYAVWQKLNYVLILIRLPFYFTLGDIRYDNCKPPPPPSHKNMPSEWRKRWPYLMTSTLVLDLVLHLG